jgi:hypothetical protein
MLPSVGGVSNIIQIMQNKSVDKHISKIVELLPCASQIIKEAFIWE